VGGCFFFFFKQKTAYEIRSGDWSSDVCSSDLAIFVDRLRLANVPGAFCHDATGTICMFSWSYE